MFLQEYIASIDDIFQTINPNEKPRNKHFSLRKYIFNEIWWILWYVMWSLWYLFKFVVHEVTFCTNMCFFKQTYLANQEAKWKTVKYPFYLTEIPFQWDIMWWVHVMGLGQLKYFNSSFIYFSWGLNL